MSKTSLADINTILSFSRHETKIWQALEKGSWNVSQLATLTRFPRTTLYTALDSLRRRGLITTRRQGKSVIISPIPRQAISDLLTESALAFNEIGNVRISSKKKNNSGFTLIYGKKAMFNVWENLAKKGVKRFSVIQPSRSLLHTISRFTPEEFITVNDAIKKNSIIVDAIIREDNLPTYMNFHKNNPAAQKNILKSFLGRMADTTLVRDDYLNNNADLILTSKSAFLMNWENEIGIEIDNPDMIDLLRELFTLAKGYGKKIDFNQYMREYLEKIE